MGSWDTYCAFCAGYLGSIKYAIQLEEEDPEGEKLDPRLQACTNWLKRARCIGISPEGERPANCFVSGLGRGDDYGQIAVTRGDDPNFPAGEPTYMLTEDGEALWVLSAYHEHNGDMEPVFPFHDACMEIFKLTVAHQTHASPQAIDKDALYQAFSTFNRLEHVPSLDIDYFELEDWKGAQYFSLRDYATAWVLDPLQVHGDLEAYCETSPAMNPASPVQPVVSRSIPSQDFFSKLPEELILRIIGLLPLRGITSFRLASRAAAATPLGNSVWRDIMFSEMPWLSEVFPAIRKAVDNRELFKAMRGASKFSDLSTFGGLANRRRIWNICLQIVPAYLANLTDDPSALDEIRWNSKSFSVCHVGQNSDAGDSSNFVVWFAVSCQELEEEESTLEIHWTSHHELCGFTMVVGSDSRTIGIRDYPNGHKDVATFQSADWLTGFIFNIQFTELQGKIGCGITGLMVLGKISKTEFFGSQQGYKRVFECRNPDAVVTGLLAQTSAGIITQIGLLEYTEDTSITPSPPPVINTHLWRDTLPPSTASMVLSRSGPYNFAVHPDLYPFEALVFGTNEKELASVAAIVASPQLDYFEVQYSNGKPPRTIGQSTKAGTKRFSIDWQGGEKIVNARVCMTPSPRGLWILTNFKRQCIFGNYLLQNIGPEKVVGRPLYGLYCLYSTFGLRDPGEVPAQVGMLVGPECDLDPPSEWNMAIIDNESGFCWEPSPPPKGLQPTSKIYGSMEAFTRESPNPESITPTVTWVDFSRAIVRVSGLQAGCSTDARSGDELDSPLRFEYSDGSELVIPVTQLYTPPKGGDASHSAPGCANHELTEVEQQTNEWQPTHGKVTAVTLWASDGFDGLQFHDCDGDSPRWGKCGGIPAGKLVFDVLEPESIVALNLFVCHSPSQITAVQGMSRGA